MKRYSELEKQEALQRAKEIGVKRTCEEMNIAIQSLYKWRNDEKQALNQAQYIMAATQYAAAPAVINANAAPTNLAGIVQVDDIYEPKIRELEAENHRLRQIIVKLKQVIVELS